MAPTDQTLIEGIRLALKNAQVLFDDAEFLKSNKKFARAYFHYQISIEELGKAHILFTALLNEDHRSENSLKTLFKNTRDHKIKTTASINTEILILQVIPDKDMALELIKSMKIQYDNIEVINNYKNNSLYVNYDNGTFRQPEDYINIDLVERIAQISELRLAACKNVYPLLLAQLDSLRTEYQKVTSEVTPQKIEEWTKRYIIDNWDI